MEEILSGLAKLSASGAAKVSIKIRDMEILIATEEVKPQCVEVSPLGYIDTLSNPDDFHDVNRVLNMIVAYDDPSLLDRLVSKFPSTYDFLLTVEFPKVIERCISNGWLKCLDWFFEQIEKNPAYELSLIYSTLQAISKTEKCSLFARFDILHTQFDMFIREFFPPGNDNCPSIRDYYHSNKFV
jgi:hypothetical protein